MSYGFLTGPKYEFSLVFPIANSSMFVLPTKEKPACKSFSTAVAVYGEI